MLNQSEITEGTASLIEHLNQQMEANPELSDFHDAFGTGHKPFWGKYEYWVIH